MAKVQATALTNVTLQDARTQLVAAVKGLSISIGGTWLPAANPYLAGGAQKVVEDCKNGHADFDDVAAFVGASAFVHAADAWSYIGRSLDALLKADLHAAVHLAYYAELRGAKSLLATDGVFVGNNYSCALAGNSTLIPVNYKGTHSAAWELMAQWFQQPGPVSTVSSIVAPGGESLSTWVTALPGGVAAVVQDMLAGIAFDLQSFHEDRERRNLASYEPTTMVPSTLSVEIIKQTISSLWLDIEPLTGGDFPGIDRAVLANVLVRQYRGQHATPDPSDPSREIVDWSSWEGWIDTLTPSSQQASALHQALRGDPTSSDFQLLLGAAFTDTSGMLDPTEFIRSMLGRSAVLARLATGACLDVLTDAGKTLADLVTWIEPFAVSRGYIDSAPLPSPATDLLADLAEPRELLELSEAATLGVLLRDLSDGVSLLAQTDRVAAWSFA